MRFFSNTTRAILAGAALATTLMSTASAQADYPNRPVSVGCSAGHRWRE